MILNPKNIFKLSPNIVEVYNNHPQFNCIEPPYIINLSTSVTSLFSHKKTAVSARPQIPAVTPRIHLIPSFFINHRADTANPLSSATLIWNICHSDYNDDDYYGCCIYYLFTNNHCDCLYWCQLPRIILLI